MAGQAYVLLPSLQRCAGSIALRRGREGSAQAREDREAAAQVQPRATVIRLSFYTSNVNGPVVRVEHQVVDPEPAQVVRRRQARLAGSAATVVSG